MARRKTGQASGRQQRRSTSRKRSTGRSLPGWLWGLGGLGVGLGVALLVHWHYTGGGPQQLNELMAPPPTSPQQRDSGGGTRSQGGGATAAKQDKPRFEFYRLLPEQKIEVPGGGDERQRQATRDDTAATGSAAGEAARRRSAGADTDSRAGGNRVDSDRHYLLQAGSFRGHDDADRLKARLALLGIEATIQRVELSGGELWHRVRVGPYSELDRVNTVRRRLQENGIETILLKRSG